ncbi:MAG: sensory histidine kinase AtoS [Candidatus Methanofastidiosum methylothiophilum]|uniref:histidine kinase n=1 Tax=Candidatus Methanofastidiosum methylothiophilum TaxID=1705564 RepID=A0A150J8E4_9EURY|nr:MAG: sensory histidine kinase AtoS [Candidatus Methanofastidiosum methylthiophilus]
MILIFPFQGSFITFHSLAELISIIIAAGIFIVVWNSKNFVENKYYLFIGTTFIFVAVLDGLHTFSYENVGILLISGPNISMQFWVAARYLQSASFLIAPFLIGRKISINKIFAIYLTLLATIVLSIMVFKIFPDCFMDQYGSTPFRKMSEVVTTLLFFLALYAHYQKRNNFDKKLFHYLTASIGFMIAVEAFFIFDIQTYTITRILVPYLKAISFYILYKALVEHNLKKPYSLLFKELKESEEKYRELANSLPEIVFETDEKGKITLVNKNTLSLTGYTKEDFEQGLNATQLVIPEDRFRVSEDIQKLIGGVKIGSREYTALRKDGSTFPFIINSTAIICKNNPIGLRGIIFDITERKENEGKIKNLNETIKILNKILRHDILNDLTLLLNIVDSHKDYDEVMKKRVFSTINKSVNLIERMRELENALVSEESLSGKSLRIVAESVVKNYPDIKFSIKGDCTVLCDGAIYSVIDNIVRNAIIHGKTDIIDITIDDNCEMRIADYGKGIPSDIKEKIFEEGESFGESRGSGLGLYIVKKILERYNGSIKVEDNKPNGAVFVLKFRK